MPKNKNNDFISGNQAELVQELETLSGLIRSRENGACGQDRDPGALLALLKLCPDLDHESWTDLSHRHCLGQWLALPLDGENFPFLARLQSILDELSYQTDHDPLTGLYNRRAFDRTLAQEMERSRRSGSAISLAIVDIDDFKRINDTFGHPCGDKALAGLARVLLTGIRRYDVAARMGGEEFGLILPGAGVMKAEATVERILQAVRDLRFACPDKDSRFSFTCSVGLVSFKGVRQDTAPPDLVAISDKALYDAKHQGKDRVVTVPITDFNAETEATIVEADEKRFLFTGS